MSSLLPPGTTQWFGPAPELLPDERLISYAAANRTQGKRAVGGRLHITTHRLVFRPNVIDANLGGKPWSCTLAEIVNVCVEPGRFAFTELFSGGLRDRLRIDLRDERRELFVIAEVNARIDALRTLLAVETGAVEPTERAASASPLPAMRVVDERKP